MMNCERVSSNLSRYYDGEMPEEEACLCAEHIRGCEACRCELESFQSITSAMAGRQFSEHSSPPWDQLSERMQSRPVSTAPSGGSVEQSTNRRFSWPLIGVGLALAASVLLILFAPFKPVVRTSEIAVDLSPVIDRYAEPSQALAQLNKQFSGRTVDKADLKSLLGYEPLLPTGLPGDLQVVSTSVLKLPVCICEAGKCTCGPAGCNCSATLCKRSDGSELLVIEHCNSEKVELSKRPARTPSGSDRPLELFGSENHLTASWVAKDRRLTAIGLLNEREALDLMASNDRP